MTYVLYESFMMVYLSCRNGNEKLELDGPDPYLLSNSSMTRHCLKGLQNIHLKESTNIQRFKDIPVKGPFRDPQPHPPIFLQER